MHLDVQIRIPAPMAGVVYLFAGCPIVRNSLNSICRYGAPHGGIAGRASRECPSYEAGGNKAEKGCANHVRWKYESRLSGRSRSMATEWRAACEPGSSQQPHSIDATASTRRNPFSSPDASPP